MLTSYFKLFLLILSLHLNIAWAMESDDGFSSHIPSRPVVQKEAFGQEQLKTYTHSHANSPTSHIKALYIASDAKLIVADPQRNTSWTRPIITSSDDRYMRLVKGTYIKYPGNNTPNHLMVCMEPIYYDPDKQVGKFHSFPLKYNGSIRDFCSAPPLLAQSLSINLAGESREENVVVTPSVQLKKEQEKVEPTSPYMQFPILSHISHQYIGLTNSGYPHSEIDALNALLPTANFQHVVDSVRGKDYLLGIVIKFYSYNDICSLCQEAINAFIPQVQTYINKQFGDNKRKIPVIAVGVANHCYGFSSYHCKEEESCKEKYLFSNVKHIDGGIQHFLQEGVVWENLPQSQYNSRMFAFHFPDNYKPFPEAIHIPILQEWPPLYIYIKQPDTRDLQEHLKPDYRGTF